MGIAMLSRRAILQFTTLPIRRLYSSQHGFEPVPNVIGPLDTISVEEFRTRAFTPEKPLLITAGDENSVNGSGCTIPAAEKWFTSIASAPTSKDSGSLTQEDGIATLSQEYLRLYASTLLPYELITPQTPDPTPSSIESSELFTLLKHYTQYSSPTSTFHTFTPPLSPHLRPHTPLPHPPSRQRRHLRLQPLARHPTNLHPPPQRPEP